MADEKEQPIIIKKINKGGAGHHGGAWKVAFADFMTAMMAFFLVMWLVGQKPEVREGVAGYFRDPGKYESEGKSGVLKGAASAIKIEGAPITVKTSQENTGMGPSEQEKEDLALAARNILKELANKDEFNRLKKNIKMQLTSEGLRIILNESENSPAFFEPGSSKLLKKSAIILITIADELGKLSNHLVLEGHTDAAFGGHKEYTNWELSVDRANAARELMEVSGLSKDQVREVRGFADKLPMIIDDPYDNRNRRVSIVVLYQSKESQYDQIEIGADLMNDISG